MSTKNAKKEVLGTGLALMLSMGPILWFDPLAWLNSLLS